MEYIKLSKEQENKLKRRKYEDITAIVLHHSAGRGTIQNVDRMHRERGYACIGYHYYITRDGEVYNGRPVEYIGAHAKGHNKNTIGICLEGNFIKDKPTDKQIGVLALVVKNLMKNIPTIKTIYNHKDLCKTLCPVIDLKSTVLDLIEEDKDNDNN